MLSIRTGLAKMSLPPGFSTVAATESKSSINPRRSGMGTLRPMGGFVMTRAHRFRSQPLDLLKVAKVAASECGLNRFKLCRGNSSSGQFRWHRAEVCAADAADAAKEGSLDQFQTGTAKGIPYHPIDPFSGEPGHAGGQGGWDAAGTSCTRK